MPDGTSPTLRRPERQLASSPTSSARIFGVAQTPAHKSVEDFRNKPGAGFSPVDDDEATRQAGAASECETQEDLAPSLVV